MTRTYLILQLCNLLPECVNSIIISSEVGCKLGGISSWKDCLSFWILIKTYHLGIYVEGVHSRGEGKLLTGCECLNKLPALEARPGLSIFFATNSKNTVFLKCRIVGNFGGWKFCIAIFIGIFIYDVTVSDDICLTLISSRNCTKAI